MVGSLTHQRRSFSQPTQTTTLAQAELLLRDLAFVLHLTRSVKQCILEECTSAAHSSLALAATDDSL